MSTMEEQLAKQAPAAALVAPKRPRKKAKLDLADAIPRPEVEVITATEERQAKQVEKRAPKPTKCFESERALSDRLVLGIELDAEVLFGFLAAVEKITPADKAYPILSSVRLTHEVGDAKLVIEAASNALWTAVAVTGVPHGDVGFSVMAPALQAKNVVNLMRQDFKTLPLGISDGGLWIGAHRLAYGGKPEDFPSRPLLRPWEARAAVPAFYFDEICSRVLTAASVDPTKQGLHGVLLDFSLAEDRSVICTAVGSDGGRMHILELPRMKIQARGAATPPSVMIGEQFFRYLRTVANREWTALEVSETQANAYGTDYQAVAEVTLKGNAATPGLMKWRSANVEHRGCWAVDRHELERLLKLALAPGADTGIDVHLDATSEQLTVMSYDQGHRHALPSIGARRFDGPVTVKVHVNGQFLLEAVLACKTGLVQLGFAQTPELQRTSPVTIRGEEDLFKAVVMPLTY